ncbi:MAG: cupin-like domain-containing protein [Rhizobiales bacterium]|nr:cupin-like domain-containing protein [Hyphomicrobiales bacterium]
MVEMITFPKDAKDKFQDTSFQTSHSLSDHPLLQLPALIDLALKMDRDQFEYSSGDTGPNQSFEDIKHIDLEPVEVIRQIEDCGAWMVLKNVESIPEYQKLVENALDSGARAAGFTSRHDAGMKDAQGFIFVSSAHSTTAFHTDNEQNLFVQLRGRKAFHTFENRSREVVSDEALESYPGKHRNHVYGDNIEELGTVYELEPGQGIFLPYIWPHWVKSGEEFSISMAITWKTDEILRNNKLLFANGMMRKIGLPQSPPGIHPMWDNIKVAGYTLSRAMIEPFRQSERSRRFLRGLLFGRKANYYYQTGKEA